MRSEIEALEESYTAAFRDILRELAGWDDERIGAWIRSRPVDFSNPFAAHEVASWYVVQFLIPSDARKTVGPRLNALNGELTVLIERAMSVRNTDWARLRDEISDVIAKSVADA